MIYSHFFIFNALRRLRFHAEKPKALQKRWEHYWQAWEMSSD